MSQGPLPQGADSIRVKLKYFEVISLSSLVVGASQSQVYRLNSVFDPNFTGTGHQPNGFDQWAAIYGKYRVHGGTWRVELSNQDIQYVIGLAAVERANDNSLDGLVDMVQEPRSHFTIAGPRGSPKATMSSSYRCDRILGVTRQEFADQDYAATVTANPSNLVWLVLYATVQGSETLAADQALYVTIEYDVEFFEREELDSSLWKEVSLLKQYLDIFTPEEVKMIMLKASQGKKKETSIPLLIGKSK